FLVGPKGGRAEQTACCWTERRDLRGRIMRATLLQLALMLLLMAGCTSRDEPPLTHEERILQKRIERRESRGQEADHMKRRAEEMRIHQWLRHDAHQHR